MENSTFSSMRSSKTKDYIWSETFHSLFFLKWEEAMSTVCVKWGRKLKLQNVIDLLYLLNTLQKCFKLNNPVNKYNLTIIPMLCGLFLHKMCLLLPSCKQINKLQRYLFFANRWMDVSHLTCKNGATNTTVTCIMLKYSPEIPEHLSWDTLTA